LSPSVWAKNSDTAARCNGKPVWLTDADARTCFGTESIAVGGKGATEEGSSCRIRTSEAKSKTVGVDLKKTKISAREGELEIDFLK
jgi:hypothetical protein